LVLSKIFRIFVVNKLYLKNNPMKKIIKFVVRKYNLIKLSIKIRKFMNGKKKVNCILDVSGSIGNIFDPIFKILLEKNLKINLAQVDTEVRSYVKVKSMKDFKNIAIGGIGGTILQPGVDLFKDKFNNLDLIVLTDGYTDELNFNGIKNVLIISTCELVRLDKFNKNENVEQFIINL
jgi:predicted metal-dependent peptidase